MDSFRRNGEAVWRTLPAFALACAFLFPFPSAPGPVSGISEVHDPFDVMAEVERLEQEPLWPGFEPKEIPVGLFDGERTYLFGFPKIPDGFASVEGRPGVLAREGRHASVFGNTCAQLDGVWLAVSIPVRRSEFTGNAVTLNDAAGVIIHEKFHVFQAVHHPDWKPNDGLLLSYPLDSAEDLERRGQELEALRRAVLDYAPGGIAWARTAWGLRRERMAKTDEVRVRYEREIRRLEGLAEYVEYLAAGKPAAEGELPLGFAPKAIRESGYAAGRWIAVLLDRFVPGWKEELEAGAIDFPEDRLGEFLDGREESAAYTIEEKSAWSDKARAALAEKEDDRRKLLQALNNKLGITLVIDARRRPLSFDAFEPFSIEAMGPGLLLHKRGLSLKNDNGFVRIFGLQALTETDRSGRALRIFIPGLSRRVGFAPNRRKLRFQSDGLTLDLSSVLIRARGSYGYTVELR